MNHKLYFRGKKEKKKRRKQCCPTRKELAARMRNPIGVTASAEEAGHLRASASSGRQITSSCICPYCAHGKAAASPAHALGLPAGYTGLGGTVRAANSERCADCVPMGGSWHCRILQPGFSTLPAILGVLLSAPPCLGMRISLVPSPQARLVVQKGDRSCGCVGANSCIGHWCNPSHAWEPCARR